MISLTSVTFSYRGAEASSINEVSFDVSQGEVVALVGATGAGKTTTCLLCNGLIPQTVRGRMSGQVTINGLDTKETPISELAKLVGMVFENPEAQFLGDSVEEEVAFGPENLCLAVDDIRSRVAWALETVAMNDYFDRFPFYLSGGQKQRVAIAGALAMRPELLVLDEPTSELDPQGKRQVLVTVQRLKDELQKTIILATHETDEAAAMVDRVILIGDGRVVLDGSPVDVLSSPDALHSGVREPQLFELWRLLDDASLGSPPLTVEQAAGRIGSRFRPVKPERNGMVAQNDTVIEVRDLVSVYPNGVEALRGINLDVTEGEFLALVGQNGSGKTTLSKHFNGLLKPTSGTVRVRGVDTRQSSVADLARKVGYAFQNPDHQLFEQSVSGEIAFGLRNIGLEEQEIVRRTAEALEAVSLDVTLDQYPYFLGKGERQKLALASILAMKPRILMVDEPTTGQDWRSALDVLETLRSLNKEGHTVIIISHDMRLVAEYASRMVVMNDGRIIAEGDPRQVMYSASILEEASLRPPPVVRLAREMNDGSETLGILSAQEFCACISPRSE